MMKYSKGPRLSAWLIITSFFSPSASFSNCQRSNSNHASTATTHSRRTTISQSFMTKSDSESPLKALTLDNIDENDAWDFSLTSQSHSDAFSNHDDNIFSSSQPEWRVFLETLAQLDNDDDASVSQPIMDALWEHIRLEAATALRPEPQAGPQLFGGILSHPSLVEAISTVISHEIETELMPATSLKNLFLEQLTPQDEMTIHLDIIAAVMRSPGRGNAMSVMLFHRGLHALVCYRVGHRLWQAGRTGLAYYLQSTVSRKYSADIHPAARIGAGIYLVTGGGVVVGETAVVGEDVTIMQGVTLGGTGKEAGDRHPKVGNGVILHDSATVLGNILVGDGAVVMAKSIVTKPVPPLALVTGVPARIISYRELTKEEFESDDLQQSLGFKYMQKWQQMAHDSSNL